jgi:chemotaxis methyl-accepting protein methylase
MKKAIDRLIDVVNQTCGRDISLYDESFLAKALGKRLTATCTQTAAAYTESLAESPAEAAEFLCSLNITHSEFFRNALTFALLEHLVLPGLVAEKGDRSELRIWSAGCAAGQEVYSVAILLDAIASTRGRPISLRILATDVSKTALALARQGIYDKVAVQNVRLKHICGCFVRQGNTYTIAARLRDQVGFSFHDLLDRRSASPPASIYGDFDLVLCGNLLFYYRPEGQQVILNNVYTSLSRNGYLVTGEAERALVEKMGGFRVVAPPAAVFQKPKRE